MSNSDESIGPDSQELQFIADNAPSEDEESLQTDEGSVDGEVEILADTEAADAALWKDEHTSDEVEYVEAEGDEEHGDEEDDELEENEECAHHELCVSLAKEIDEVLCSDLDAVSEPDERLAALEAVVCNHYTKRSE